MTTVDIMKTSVTTYEEDHFMPFYKFKHCSKMDLCIKNDRFHKDTNTIKMRYRNSKGEKVKVNSSLRAPFKETLAVVLSCQYQAHYQNDSKGLAGIFFVRPRKKTQGEKTQEFRNSSKKLKLKRKISLFGILVNFFSKYRRK